jgi:hypothetical protein
MNAYKRILIGFLKPLCFTRDRFHVIKLVIAFLLCFISFLLFGGTNVKSEGIAADYLINLPASSGQERSRELENLCGPLCDVREGRKHDSLYFQERTVDTRCAALFDDLFFSTATEKDTPAPRNIPDYLSDAYTFEGKIPVRALYYDEKRLNLANSWAVWPHALVEDWVKAAQNGSLPGAYGVKESDLLLSVLSKTPQIHQGKILVIGSNRPWVEAILLAAGANSVSTVEYGQKTSEHPKLSILTPVKYQTAFREGELFDAVVLIQVSNILVSEDMGTH